MLMSQGIIKTIEGEFPFSSLSNYAIAALLLGMISINSSLF